MGLESGPAQSIGRINPSDIVSAGPPGGMVTPSAVSALTDAFRQGFITADDVVQRVGEHAKTKEKAQIALNKEVVSPENTAARAAQVAASTSGANLQNAQSSAALPLVPAQAGIASEQLRQQAAEQDYGAGSIKAFHDLAPLAPGFDGTIPKDEHGNTDYDAMAKEGASLQSQYALKQQALSRLQPTEHVDTKGAPGTTGRKDYNAFREDVTPGSQMHQTYSSVLNTPLTLKYIKPGTTMSAPGTAAVIPAPTVPAPATPQTQTLYGANAQAAADAAEQAANGQPTVTPLAAPVTQKPVVTPAVSAPAPNLTARPGLGTYDPNLGVITASDTSEQAGKITENFRKLDSYKEWEAALPFQQSMLAAAQAYQNPTPEELKKFGGPNYNARDLQLAESVMKLYDPRGVVRSFKWDKITEAQPWAAKLDNLVPQLTKNGTLTPETRTALLQIGMDNVRGREQSLTPYFEQARDLGQKAGIAPEDIFTSKELKILNGDIAKPFSGTATPNGASQQQGASKPITLSTGKTVYRDASGKLVVASPGQQ